MDALAFIGVRLSRLVGPKAAFEPKGTRIAIVYLALLDWRKLSACTRASLKCTRNHRSCVRPDARCDNACAARGGCRATEPTMALAVTSTTRRPGPHETDGVVFASLEEQKTLWWCRDGGLAQASSKIVRVALDRGGRAACATDDGTVYALAPRLRGAARGGAASLKRRRTCPG